MQEDRKTVIRRLIKSYRHLIWDCDANIKVAAWFGRYPGLAPIDVEFFRIRKAGCKRAIKCIRDGQAIDKQAIRMVAVGAEVPVFKFLCNECHEPMLYVDKYLVCPKGHGRLIPIEPMFRKGPEYRKRRIGQGNLNRFLRGDAPPPGTKLCTCGERIAAEEERCGLCNRSAELNSAKQAREGE